MHYIYIHTSLTISKKRIQAAQERARLAEQKEKEAKEAAALEVQRKVEQERIQKAQSALRSVAGRALEDKQRSIMAQLEGTKEVVALDDEEHQLQQQQQQQPAAGVPIMKSLDPPPPSFDSMKFPPPKEMQQQIQHPHLSSNSSSEMVGHGMNSRVLNSSDNKTAAPPPPPPPSFDFVEQQMGVVESSAPPAPTAPSISPGATVETTHEPTELHHLHGIMPVAAPPLSSHQQPTQVNMPPPPPSFAVFESQQQQQVVAPPPSSESVEQSNITVDDDCLAYDENGNPLSPEQRQALLDEQRQLYENIMKEKAANDAAIAQANADAFDLRSSSAAARAMSGSSGTATTTSSNLVDSNRVMDSVGRNVEPTTAAAGSTSAAGTDTADDEATRRESRRMVQIGNNQMVALHGQDRTKKAIKEGTAILVQCINCQNWMQVTDTATLMFCPVCQVVSPVIHQNEVMTKEEAIQLTMDRKLAEKLQAEAYEQGGSSSADASGGTTKEDEGYIAKFFGGIGGFVADATDGAVDALSSSPTTSTTTAGGGEQERSDSWWNKISSIVSYGVEHDRGELGVTRPPGQGAPASQYPAAQQRSSTTTATVSGRSPTHHEEEIRGLLSPVVVDGNEANLPSGRVAEQRPLFSCVMDSVNSATAAVFSTGEDVEGIDSSSLLVTNAGRGVGDGECDYEQLPDRA